ncbi:MAG: maltose alpha-D-glucosyltransferase, partial [candidate division Zixibacteria bacterium]|nr:maltose alpha-D-glucosyltransferase [candidate division Zixibacteria bacterium]NIR65411.1 maltose alpha-D-glucosyltransferase [candidate division Zixibacteria bacterium]NIS47106.1 maltose alpha-D-glucosyltransferase [candidate division Zixibacteria bacterium]NIT51739.1 maltose alpha-D-glucosyltransferase [candidate division Zixibacteria bacterium]NIU15240.1 maltose alpha-D-glucosyltransferase [candidate division Zixibacteria bacterium]
LKDDGYDIADYYGVHSDYGNLQDFKALIDEAHHRGLKVISDLVLNHTSDQHPWFQEARKDRNSPYHDYYVWSDVDTRYQEARIIFLDTESSNWTWDEVAQQYYWHRFFSSQPDLNFDNPAVIKEMKQIAKFWLDMGIDGFRADAVPYLYEREGTNCENLPETHDFLKELRSMMDEEYPEKILLCEANQWPEDVRAYFGDGDEFHMAFHFPIMPRIYMSIRKEDVTDMVNILNRTPTIPENCQWVTFLRNHDELTLEMVTEDDRQWMWHEYAPHPRMRLNLGIRRRLAPLLDNDQRKIELAYSILFTLPGSPIIYYGDEIGMGDNIWLNDRDGVRTPMQWDSNESAGFSRAESGKFYSPVISTKEYSPEIVNVAANQSNPDSLYNTIKHMISVRRQHQVFNSSHITWLDANSKKIASYMRYFENERLLIIQNLSDQQIEARVSIPEFDEHTLVNILDSNSEYQV